MNADTYATNLNDYCTGLNFPIFQDTIAAGVWTQHQAEKDDIIIYTKEGILSAFLPNTGAPMTNMGSADGVANVTAAICHAGGWEDCADALTTECTAQGWTECLDILGGASY